MSTSSTKKNTSSSRYIEIDSSGKSKKKGNSSGKSNKKVNIIKIPLTPKNKVKACDLEISPQLKKKSKLSLKYTENVMNLNRRLNLNATEANELNVESIVYQYLPKISSKKTIIKPRIENVKVNKQINNKNKGNCQEINASTLPLLYEGFVTAFKKFKDSEEFKKAYEVSYKDFLNSQVEFKKLQLKPEFKMSYRDFLNNIYDKK